MKKEYVKFLNQHYFYSLPVRILVIPVLYVALVVFAVVLPFICLFGKITFKGK